MVITTRMRREGEEEQNPKKTKTDQQSEEREVDMISELPDDILYPILSLLTLKEACITSALSKRWRNLFPSIPRLNFDLSSFRYSRVRAILGSRRAAVRICAIRSSYFHTYRKDFGNIIRFLCNDDIQELTLNNGGPRRYTVPSCVYFCQTLTRIELSECILKVPSKFILRRLNTLRIKDCIVEDGDMQRLILGCPAVERLTLVQCHRLRNLAVDAPKLAVLDVTTYMPLAVSIVNAPRLESGTLRFIYVNDVSEGECSRHVGLQESIGSIQNLSIQKNTFLKGLAVPVTLQSLLPNMKKLTLIMRPNDTLMLSAVSCLLDSCPNLEDLVIGDYDVYDCIDSMYPEASMLDYWDQQMPSDCIRNSLSTATVVLKDINYWEHWIKLAKFLLNNACVLKNLIIVVKILIIGCYRKDKSRLGDLQRELLLLQRASLDAVVELRGS